MASLQFVISPNEPVQVDVHDVDSWDLVYLRDIIDAVERIQASIDVRAIRLSELELGRVEP